MGGRGSGSKIPQIHPSGEGAGGDRWSKGIGFQNYDSLKDAIGKKGRSKSMADATLNSNPHFDKTMTYKEFTENCQRCVIAYELRRRGYDVTAQPTYKNDNLPSQAYRDRQGRRWSYWMGAFQGAKPESIAAGGPEAAVKALNAAMKRYGDGSRAVLQLVWRGGMGHVVNVEYRNGRVYLNDAQSGGKYSARELFAEVRTADTQLVRVDNLKISERAKKSVTKDKW